MAFAETFKSSEFLAWKQESQEFYIRTSVGMAGFIAAQNDKKHADCLESWYLEDEKKSNDFIFDVMGKYPEYHPRGVIVAVLEKQCGKFDYTNQ